MLTLPRSTTAARRLFLHARTLSAVPHNVGSPKAGAEQPSSSAAPDDEATENRQQQTHLANLSAECMYVYPWNGIRSSAEGLAIARAVQDKYGPAREVIFPRDQDCINVFRPYFWIVYDSQDVRKRLPEQSAQLRVHVADLPRSNGNVGIEEMTRGLGLSTTENNNNDAPREPQAASEEEAPKNDSDASEGYKTLDVRVEWAQYSPFEVQRPKRRPFSVSNDATLPKLASAWLAFDGFSPESARGPHTPNLLRVREKWQNVARAAPSQSPSSSPSALDVGEDPTSSVALKVPPSHGPAETELPESSTGTETEAQAQPKQAIPPLEWIPIPLAPASSTSPAPQHDTPDTTAAAPDDSNSVLSTTPTANSSAAADASVSASTPTNSPTGTKHTKGVHPSPKMSRRERILHLARQNARTPLPDLAAKSQQPQPPPPPPPTDEEAERQGKERTIRERLWRLVGGNY